TLVSMDKIEPSLLKELKEIGIQKDQMTLQDVGDSWTWRYGIHTKSKAIRISLTDFSYINKILSGVKTRGVDNIHIAELKNKDITEFRKEVKIMAVKAAKEKAQYLLESVGEELGMVIEIREVNAEAPFFRRSNLMANSYSEASSNESVDNVRSITLRYEISAVFAIGK
ncbi:MAG: SIMPL domain-containing protein, partial [Bacteroidota bacterium]